MPDCRYCDQSVDYSVALFRSIHRRPVDTRRQHSRPRLRQHAVLQYPQSRRCHDQEWSQGRRRRDRVHVQPLNKSRYRRTFRRRTPAQHARFLEHVSTLQIEVGDNDDTQTNFDTVYGVMLDTFYPERWRHPTRHTSRRLSDSQGAAVAPESPDAHRADRTDEAGATAARIHSTIITRSSTRWLRTIDTRKSVKDAWAKVREVIKEDRHVISATKL